MTTLIDEWDDQEEWYDDEDNFKDNPCEDCETMDCEVCLFILDV